MVFLSCCTFKDHHFYTDLLLLQALLVFILYVRSTAINPADPGIMSKFSSTCKLDLEHRLPLHSLSNKYDDNGSGLHSPTESRNSSAAQNWNKKGSEGEKEGIDVSAQPVLRKSCFGMGAIFCVLFIHEDCRKQEVPAEQQGASDEALFCTLCNAEVKQWAKNIIIMCHIKL